MTEKVLVLDDEALIAYDLADTVKGSGRHVIGPAISINEARKLAEKYRPDTALLDINIRGQTVWALAHELRDLGCKLIFCSANAAPPDPDFPFCDCVFIPKPSAPSRILEALDRVQGQAMGADPAS